MPIQYMTFRLAHIAFTAVQLSGLHLQQLQHPDNRDVQYHIIIGVFSLPSSKKRNLYDDVARNNLKNREQKI
jgi:hypothetical protein